MKVVCDSCQAKYQVPDERVAGKKLKIRFFGSQHVNYPGYSEVPYVLMRFFLKKD